MQYDGSWNFQADFDYDASKLRNGDDNGNKPCAIGNIL